VASDLKGERGQADARTTAEDEEVAGGMASGRAVEIGQAQGQ